MWEWLSDFVETASSVGPVLALAVLLVVAVGMPIAVGRAVLGPINHAAGTLKAPTRFQLSDFLWLLVHVQLALGYCVEFVGVRQRFYFPLMLGFLSLAVLGLWAGGVSFLSRAGVTHPPRRAVFILLLLPLTLALMMTTTILLVVAVVTSAGLIDFSYDYRSQIAAGYERLAPSPWLMGLAVAALPVLGYALRRGSIWVVAEREVPLLEETPTASSKSTAAVN
jgi:hypothetical protein